MLHDGGARFPTLLDVAADVVVRRIDGQHVRLVVEVIGIPLLAVLPVVERRIARLRMGEVHRIDRPVLRYKLPKLIFRRLVRDDARVGEAGYVILMRNVIRPLEPAVLEVVDKVGGHDAMQSGLIGIPAELRPVVTLDLGLVLIWNGLLGLRRHSGNRRERKYERGDGACECAGAQPCAARRTAIM